MDGHPVDVEVSITPGLPAFTIVGLPDPSIQEARERVRAAILASSEEWPLKRVTVNLSPAHLRKTGSSFDLAVAVAVLAAGGRIPHERLGDLCVLGELSLDGSVRPVRGVLPSVLTAARERARAVVVPAANAREAALVRNVDVFAVEHLAQTIRFLRGECSLEPWQGPAPSPAGASPDEDLADVRGNDTVKDALVVAAAGGHNLLMIGAPGGGKTMLARRLPGILPPMTEAEAFEVTRIYSVAGLLPDDQPLVTQRPFRAPHHSASMTGLVGGGSGVPRPGEASLAHRGVLFMDEFGEFRRETLQALRQPIEDGRVTIVRSKWCVTYPARFQLVAVSNPCPCGYRDDPIKPCACSDVARATYQERLSGPIIDRIDILVHVQRVTGDELFGATPGESSATVAARVAAAREFQRARLHGRRETCNAELPARNLERRCMLDAGARAEIRSAVERAGLSARGAHRVMRVARTIADLAASETTTEAHVQHALQMRLS